MLNSGSLEEREARYCSWGDTVHYNEPVKYFVAAEGSFVFDAQDQRFLDVQMGYSAFNFGYANRFFLDRMHDQIERLPQLASEYLSVEKVKLSEAICATTEDLAGRPGRVHFNVGGAQAVDDALKLVAVNRGSRRVFAFEGSYHGRTIGASSITSSFRYRNHFGEFGSRAYFVPYPYCFRCPYGQKFETCDYYCVKQFERLFETEYFSILDPRRRQTEYVAFFVEPLQGTGGYVVPPPEYFIRLKRILDEFNILLIDDEIQMGFFRTGRMWAMEHFGAAPDVLVFGKSLTNGLNPLSGIWAAEELIGPTRWPPGSTHSTFGSNPFGMTAGLATFDWISSCSYENSVPRKGEYLLNGLRELQRAHSCIGEVQGLGLALRVEMCFDDGLTPHRALAQTMKNAGLRGGIDTSKGRYGLLLDIGGYYKNVFTLAPSLEISQEEMDLFLELFASLLHECTQ